MNIHTGTFLLGWKNIYVLGWMLNVFQVENVFMYRVEYYKGFDKFVSWVFAKYLSHDELRRL